MSTPLQRSISRDQRTQCSGRKRNLVKTPQSGLTPNDDKAERASIRRKRRSEALRKSLSDAFNEQQQDAARPTLSPEALNNMFEQCIKLAAENKITDKNVWQLDLIQHLPSIVLAGQTVNTSAFNFQKISGGLDAGVTIYSKRVDHTYKEVFQTLQCNGPSKGDADDDPGCEDDGEGDIEDAAGAAAKQAKQQTAAAKRSKQGAAKEEATLATAEQLRQKKTDTTFAVDPLFHKMSALFDEGGAKGLLLINRSVYKGARIMTDPHDIPEHQFPLQAAAEPDVLINLKPLKQQLTACHAHRSAATADGKGLLFTPDLPKLCALLDQATRQAPGQGQRQRSSVDVGTIIAQATQGLAPTPMPSTQHGSSRTTAASTSSAAEEGPSVSSPVHMECDDAAAESQQAPASTEQSADIGDGAAVVGSSAMDDFLAEAANADPDEEAATACDHDDGDGAGDHDDSGHPGFADEGDSAAGSLNATAERIQRRQSLGMLGLAGSMDDTEGEVLNAEALQELLGGGSGGRRATSKYKAKAAAIARMAGATSKKMATNTSGKGKRRSPQRLDFNNIPELPDIVKGTRKQTCLAKAAGKASVKQQRLSQEQQYLVSNLARLSLRPTAISTLRILQSTRHKVAAESTADAAAADEASDLFSAGDDSGWGGDGYDDDGDYGGGAAGADGYNAGDLSMGDLSMGDPGYNAAGYGSDAEGDSGDWWNADSELLRAPKRAAGLGINYNHSAKQVDVRALKDLLWHSLVSANQQATASQHAKDSSNTQHPSSTAGAAPTVPFQDVIVSVPEQSDAGDLSDVSVHMCFICLLHLANEKGLVIKAKEDLRTLTISNVQQV